MGDLFLDIENTIFHVLLKQGLGKSILEGTFSSSFYCFISSAFFGGVVVAVFFPPRGLGVVDFTEKFNYL